jgi:hypothetical protein
MNEDPTMPDLHPEEQLASFVDGSATDEERRLVEAHLAGCARCRVEVKLAERGLVAMRALPQLEAPGLTEEPDWLRQARPEAIPVARPPARRPRRRFSFGLPVWQRVAWGAGIAAAASLAAVFLFGSLRGGPSPTTAAKGGAPNREAFAGVETSTDYDRASLGALAARVAREEGARSDLGSTAAAPLASPVPAPAGEAPESSPQSVDRATQDRALSCLQRGAGLAESVGAAYLEIASFEGRPAFIGAFPNNPSGGAPTQLLVIAVDRIDCRPLYLVTLPL